MSHLITLVLETLRSHLSNDPSLPPALQCLPSLLATAQTNLQTLEKEVVTLRTDNVEAKTVLYEMTSIQQDTKKALEDAREEIRVLKAQLEQAENLQKDQEQRKGQQHHPPPSILPPPPEASSPPPQPPTPSASLEAAEALAQEATARLSASERARAQAEGECSYWRARAGRAEVLLSGEQGVVKAQREALELADFAGESRLREAEGRFARASVRWEKGREVGLVDESPWERGELEEEELGLGKGHFGNTTNSSSGGSSSGVDTSGITSAAGPWWDGEGGEVEGEGEEEGVHRELPALPPPLPYSPPSSSPPPSSGNRKPLTPRNWTLLASGKQQAEQQQRLRDE